MQSHVQKEAVAELPCPPLAVDAVRLGQMLSVSERTIRTMDAAGDLPAPVRLGTKRKVWPVEEIRRWLAAGSPDRKAWNAIKATARG